MKSFGYSGGRVEKSKPNEQKPARGGNELPADARENFRSPVKTTIAFNAWRKKKKGKRNARGEEKKGK